MSLFFFYVMIRPPPISTLFPYPTLFRSAKKRQYEFAPAASCIGCVRIEDRKSTRLNSSHLGISYGVFCLKKKKIFHDVRAHVTENPESELISVRRRNGVLTVLTFFF